MKKKELFAISLLSILVFVSFANVSVAAPPAYVGVKKGDTYIWRASLNTVNLNTTAIALVGEDNWTLMYELFLAYFENSTGMEFDFLSGAGMKAVIQNVTDEIYPFMPGVNASGCFFDFYISYAANNWTLSTEAANETYPMVYFVDPSALNKSTIMYSMTGMPIFMSKGFNYAMFVTEYQSMIAADPYMNGNITIALQGNGFKFVYKAVFLEYLFESLGAPYEVGTLSDAEMTIRWNSNGVFDKGSLKYGGLEIATAYLETDDEGIVPGYELVTILGVSITTILAIIYIKRKKNI